MKKLLLLSVLLVITLTALSQTSKKKAPIPALPEYFTIECFDNFIDRSSKEIRKVFSEDSSNVYRYVSREERIERGWSELINKGIDLFMREDVVNGYVMNQSFIYVYYSEQSQYTKCNSIRWQIFLGRFMEYKEELESSGYLIDNKDITRQWNKQILIFNKPKRRLKLTVYENTVKINLTKVDK